MKIEIIVILYVIGLLVTVCLSLFKNKIFMTFPAIFSSVVFVITKEENWYHFAFYQVIICFISVIVQYIVKELVKKKQNIEIEKTKIKI